MYSRMGCHCVNNDGFTSRKEFEAALLRKPLEQSFRDHQASKRTLRFLLLRQKSQTELTGGLLRRHGPGVERGAAQGDYHSPAGGLTRRGSQEGSLVTTTAVGGAVVAHRVSCLTVS